MPYWSGVFEGFQGRADQEHTRQLEQDQARRAQEAEVYKYLLQSADPHMQTLALTGLMESARPGTKKKGLRGFLGEVESSPFFSTIQQYSNELIPKKAPRGVGGGPAPPTPGSAAMPANQPVRRGSQPVPAIASPTGNTPLEWFQPQEEAPVPPPPEASPPSVGDQATSWERGMLASPPPPIEMERRGTGVPTAWDIAGRTAQAQREAQINATVQALRGINASPALIERAILGLSGVNLPREQIRVGDPVDLPDGRTRIPTVWIDGQQFLGDGITPVPFGAIESQTGSGGLRQSDTLQNTPANIAWLTQNGADPRTIPNTPYIEYSHDLSGRMVVGPGREPTQPPAYSGGAVVWNPDTQTQELRPILRGGGTGPSLGTPGAAVESPERLYAQQAVESITAMVTKAFNTPGLRFSAEKQLAYWDEVTAQQTGGRYTTFFALKQAAGAAKVPPGSTPQGADRVRGFADELQRQRQQQGGPPPPTRPAASASPAPLASPVQPPPAPASAPPTPSPRRGVSYTPGSVPAPPAAPGVLPTGLQDIIADLGADWFRLSPTERQARDQRRQRREPRQASR